MMPADEEYERLGPSFFDLVLRRWMAVGEVWITDDAVGVAAWSPPDPDEVSDDVAVQMGDSFGRFGTEHLPKFAALREWMPANRPPEPHWYLNILATHPDWQQQGLARQVCQNIHDRADESGLACYLETESEINVSIYHRMGYVVRTEWNLDQADGTPGPHMWGMIRHSRCTGTAPTLMSNR